MGKDVPVEYTKVGPHVFSVPSFSALDERYTIDLEAMTCTCKAFEFGNKKPCKHIIYIQSEERRKAKQGDSNRTAVDGDSPESPKKTIQPGFDVKTKEGQQLDNVVNDLRESIKKGAESDAIHWALTIVRSKFSAYMWRQLCVIAGEDIGVANPSVLTVVVSGQRASDLAVKSRKEEAEEGIVMTVVRTMCRSPKAERTDE